MSGAVLLTSPTRVEAVGLLWSLRAAQIDARTSPTQRYDDGMTTDADADDVSVILALDIASVDLDQEVARCRALLDRPVPAVVVADRRFRSDNRRVPAATHFLDTGVDTAAVLLLVRRLLARPDEGRHLSTATAAPAGALGGVGGLTAREEQVADLASMGMRNEEIADRLDISAHTVRTHVGRVLAKLDVQHRVALNARLRQLRGTRAVSRTGVGT